MKPTPNFLFALCISLYAFHTDAFAQDDAILLVITNLDSNVSLDGMEKGQSKAGSAFRITTNAGEHCLEAQAVVNGVPQNKGEVIQAEAGKQKIMKFEFEVIQPAETAEAIPVAEINFNLTGSVEAVVWKEDHPGETYPYPTFYYAFEKGDEIILDASMSNRNGTNVINVSTYPDGVVRFTNNSFVELRELKIKVPERSIYKFVFASNHAFARNCFLKIRRKPASKETAGFNPSVSLKKILTPVAIQEQQSFYINSGRNAMLQGGKSRVLVPINIPPGTIEWFYRVSASRNAQGIENVKQNFKLFAEVTTLLLDLTGTAAAVTGLAVDQLSQPPGADYCDIFLISPEFGEKFQAKEDEQWKYLVDGSRLNFKAGNVKVMCCNSGTYYLGIRNPDSGIGVNVSVEVIAVTVKEDYVIDFK